MNNNTTYHQAAFWEHEGDFIRCRLCPHACLLAEGKAGICGVRVHLNGSLQSTVYASPAAVQIDPIEKKPLYHFLPGSRTFSIGTVGCNLSCLFCQNWHLSTRQIHDHCLLTPETAVEKALEAACGSIAFTYNEPIVFAEYAMKIRDLARERHIPCIAVSNGYIDPGAREAVFGGLAAVNIDLKAFSDEIYTKYCGAHLAPVLDTISWCIGSGIHTEITTLLIPGMNDDANMLHREFMWIAEHCGKDIPLHLSAFHPDHKMCDHPATPGKTLEHARQIAIDCGLSYVYVGNYPGFDNHTYCPVCGEVVVERLPGRNSRKIQHEHHVPIIWSIE
ncbi:MAG: AmmeMemoRadiSam system radical SAM enzyme [FCB group bacterium]|nr:AmmeMemoRadiSam system radical SAM enzyme [FCB group bacterium]